MPRRIMAAIIHSVATITNEFCQELDKKLVTLTPAESMAAQTLSFDRYNNCTVCRRIGVSEKDLDSIVDELRDDCNVPSRERNQVKRNIRSADMTSKIIASFCIETPTSNNDSCLLYGIVVGKKRCDQKYDLSYGVYACKFHKKGSNVSVETLQKIFTNKAIQAIKSTI